MEVAWDDVTSGARDGKERPLWAYSRDLTLLIEYRPGRGQSKGLSMVSQRPDTITNQLVA